MTEELISFDTAKLAKEKGFDEKVYREYDKSGYLRCTSKSADVVLGPYDELLKSTEYPAPTQSVLQQWLREKHQIIVDVSLDFFNSYTKESIKYSPTFYTYSNNKKRFWIYTDYINSDECTKKMQEEMPIFQNYSTYEEALEIGLQEGLKLIK